MSQADMRPDRGTTTGTRPPTPGWVKVFGILFVVLILLVGVMLLTGGEHSPSRHAPPVSVTEQTPPADDHIPPMKHGLQQP